MHTNHRFQFDVFAAVLNSEHEIVKSQYTLQSFGRTLFADLPQDFIATRYHSLIVERDSLPDCLEISAETADGLIMGLRHREQAVEGVQFHPESILTGEGKPLLKNFLDQ